MKFVRVVNKKVIEVIPEKARPIEKWYNKSFARQCVEAPDDVKPNWVYDPESHTFSEPVQVEPEETAGETEPKLEPDIWNEIATAISSGYDKTSDELTDKAFVLQFLSEIAKLLPNKNINDKTKEDKSK